MADLETVARDIANAVELPSVATLRELTRLSREEKETRRKKEAEEKRRQQEQRIAEALDAAKAQFKVAASNAAYTSMSSCKVEVLEGLARFSDKDTWTLEIKLRAANQLASTLREMGYLVEVESIPFPDCTTEVVLTVTWERGAEAEIDIPF